jgi:hypothetical protein
MTSRGSLAAAASFAAALLLAACGGSTPPTTPITPKPPIDIIPPQNSLPSIDAIVIQGRRAKQPPRFADVKETVDVVATVRDSETPLDELIYQWTVTDGTITGTGRAVTWTAPDTVTAPATVTITLKITENFGYPGQAKIYSQDVSGTQTLDLHDSVREVGEMARQFLVNFSDTNLNDWQYVMRNFKASACPLPGEVEAEKNDVIRNYTEFDMNAFNVGAPRVTLQFGGFCQVSSVETSPGDACAVVPVMWDSTRISSGSRSVTRGNDIVTAAYAAVDSRWWLCSSRYWEESSSGAYRYIR